MLPLVTSRHGGCSTAAARTDTMNRSLAALIFSLAMAGCAGEVSPDPLDEGRASLAGADVIRCWLEAGQPFGGLPRVDALKCTYTPPADVLHPNLAVVNAN